MLLLLRNMEKVILSMLIFAVCNSHQRPQLDVDVPPPQQTTSTAESTTADSTTEETRSLEKISQVTEATEPAAVSVQTSVNFSSSSEVFEDFKPSNYYGPDGNPIFERPSPEVGHEIFHKPHLFARPNGQFLEPPKSADNNNNNNIVFPQVTQKHYSENSQYDSQPDGPVESRGPYKFTTGGVIPQSQSRDPYKLFTTGVLLPQPQSAKPMKHDYGGGSLQPVSYYDENLYERHFGKMPHLHGNEMSAYPDVVHEPPKFHHGGGGIAVHKKDPWRSVLKVLATILPVGLLLASFPPTVIKVNSTQYPYQFQKNSTAYNPNVVVGRYKALRKKNPGRKMDGKDESPRYLDDCLKKKICETIKSNYSHSELETLQQNYKQNRTADDGPPTMMEIARAAASADRESCQVFVCSND